ncbi:MAG: septation protein A [Burkholderiaceae bacterium]|jgi:intracellular septation protein
MTKLLADWLPIILFFVAYKLADLYVATAVAIVASALLMGWMRIRGLPIDKMQWLSLGLIVVFGGATLLLQDERFIKLKPSLLYGLFGLGLLIPQLFMGTRLIEKLLADKVQLPEAAWARLNAAWGLFFLFMAGLNLYVAAAFSTDTWVDFKLFGTIGLMLLFVLAQGVYISRFQPQDPP